MHDSSTGEPAGSDTPPPILGLVLAGMLIALATAGVFVGFATVAEIRGAVVASGVVAVEGRSKRIQHQEGGLVAEIMVDNGMKVSAGDVLVRLDDTQTRAKLAIIVKQLHQQSTRAVRLRAERDDGPLHFSDPTSAEEQEQQALESAQYRTRKEAMASQRSQLASRIAAKELEISGIEADIAAIDRQRAIASREHAGLKTLFDQQHVPITRLLQLEREVVGLEGRRGQQVANVARAKEQIAETQTQLDRVSTEFQRDVLSGLFAAEAKIAELTEQRISAEDTLHRVIVRAPSAGLVHERAVHTVGGVVKPGDTLMVIVPTNDRLLVEARAAPQDVDQLAVGQDAIVRFSNFNRLTTPELAGRVTHISAAPTALDGEAAPQAPPARAPSAATTSSQPFYLVRIEIADVELLKLQAAPLLPGMMVDAFITTDRRTLLSYILKPLEDRFAHALRER